MPTSKMYFFTTVKKDRTKSHLRIVEIVVARRTFAVHRSVENIGRQRFRAVCAV